MPNHPSGSARTKLVVGYGLMCRLLLVTSILTPFKERNAPEVLAKGGTPGMREYAGPPSGEMFNVGFDCDLLASIPKQVLADYRVWHR